MGTVFLCPQFALRTEFISQGIPMSFIRCPYCQSTQVRQTDSGNAHANYFEQLQRCISPTQMAMFGMQLAKKAGLPPFAGAAVGVVVGGVLVVVSQYAFEKYYSNAEQYLCLDCQQAFAWVP
jgi:DNA-directed RNA polymerase subunit RPC12/RpoP